MAWLDGPVPHCDPNHRGALRWAIDVNGYQPVGPEHWRWIADSAAHTANECGTSTLERVIIRATAGTDTDPSFAAHVNGARWAQARIAAAGREPFRLGAYMLLRPPGTLRDRVAAQVRAFAKATLALGPERREFACIDIEQGSASNPTWAGANAAKVLPALAEAIDGVAANLGALPVVYTNPAFWRAHHLGTANLGPCTVWGSMYPATMPGTGLRKPIELSDVDRAFGRPVTAWQYGGGPLAGTAGWPSVSKSILR